jgi:hypothetical protein
VSGCVTEPSKEYILVHIPRLICGNVKAYTPQEQEALAKELDKSSPVIQAAITDYAAMREAARECKKQNEILNKGAK